MTSLRDFIFTLSIAIAFILLSLFSVIEYQGSEINADQKDKSAVASAAFDKAVKIFSVVEKMPFLRLLPANKFATDYQDSMENILDPIQSTTANYSQKLGKNSLDKVDADINTDIGEKLKKYWQTLKGKMIEEDWSRL